MKLNYQRMGIILLIVAAAAVACSRGPGLRGGSDLEARVEQLELRLEELSRQVEAMGGNNRPAAIHLTGIWQRPGEGPLADLCVVQGPWGPSLLTVGSRFRLYDIKGERDGLRWESPRISFEVRGVTAANFDGKTGDEFLLIGRRGRDFLSLWQWERDGYREIFRSPEAEGTLLSLAAGDLDDDGKPEVYVSHADQVETLVWDGRAFLSRQVIAGAGGWITCLPDREGLLITQPGTGQASLYDPAGKMSWQGTLEYSGPVVDRPEAGDLNGDGSTELLALFHPGVVGMYRREGQGFSIFPTPPQLDLGRAGGPVRRLALGDLNGDGQDEIAVESRQIIVYQVLP